MNLLRLKPYTEYAYTKVFNEEGALIYEGSMRLLGGYSLNYEINKIEVRGSILYIYLSQTIEFVKSGDPIHVTFKDITKVLEEPANIRVWDISGMLVYDGKFQKNKRSKVDGYKLNCLDLYNDIITITISKIY